MEGGAFISVTLLTGREGAEVLGGLGDGLAIETHDNTANGLIAVGNVEVDLVGDLGPLCGLGGLGEEEQAQPEQHARGEEQPPNVEHLVFVFYDAQDNQGDGETIEYRVGRKLEGWKGN